MAPQGQFMKISPVPVIIFVLPEDAYILTSPAKLFPNLTSTPVKAPSPTIYKVPPTPTAEIPTEQLAPFALIANVPVTPTSPAVRVIDPLSEPAAIRLISPAPPAPAASIIIIPSTYEFARISMVPLTVADVDVMLILLTPTPTLFIKISATPSPAAVIVLLLTPNIPTAAETRLMSATPPAPQSIVTALIPADAAEIDIPASTASRLAKLIFPIPTPEVWMFISAVSVILVVEDKIFISLPVVMPDSEYTFMAYVVVTSPTVVGILVPLLALNPFSTFKS